MKCYRPDCENKLHTGRKYCSNRCAALDRKRATLERENRPSIPYGLAAQVERAIGADKASVVLSEVNKYLQDELISIPVPLTGNTYGDLVLSYDGTQDYRPSTNLTFDVIEKMLRSGPVIFAMEMKRAQVYRVFSQGRYKVISPDKELAEVAEAALRLILPKMAQDFTWSAFAYGVSFQEEIWEWKTKEQLGMVEDTATPKPVDAATVPSSSGTKGKGKPFLVPKVPLSVNPKTVDHIRRLEDGGFNGFAQKRKLDGMQIVSIEPIIVEREQALVIPLNERFRNLWGESILKAIYVDWLWYEIIFRTMVRYMERMATPVVVAEAPSRATVTISGSSAPVKAMDLGLALAGSLSKANAVAIPSDVGEDGNKLWSLKYLTAEERAQPFLQVLEYLAQAMIRDALSADRSITQSSGGVGSYNIGEVHAAASAVTSEMILLQFLHYLNMYFMPEFSLYNRGVEGPPIWLRTQAIDTQERDLLMALVAVAGNSPAAMELFYLVDWRTLAETSNIPTLNEEQLKEFKDKLNKESEEKMKTQQEIMAKNAAPIPTGGASAFNKGSGKTAPKAPSGSGNGVAVKAEDDGDSDNVALENLFTHHIPWMLGEHEASILYEHGVISDETIKLFGKQARDKIGRFAATPGGQATISGAVHGGVPGGVTSAILSHKFNVSPAKSAVIGGAVGGGLPGALGSKVTIDSLQAGSGYLPAIVKGLVVNTVAAVGLGVATYGAIRLYEVAASDPQLKSTSLEQANDKELGILLTIIQYYASLPNRPEYLLIDVGKLEIEGVKKVDNYIIVQSSEVDGLSLESDLETIKLFNPFHEGKTGRFATGRSSGGGAGAIGGGGSPDSQGVTTAIQAKQDVLAKASAKKGFPFKTTGAILGLTGLGLIGVAVVNAATPEKGFDEYRKENLEKKATEAELASAELQELTKNWPKGLSNEQAMGLAIDNLRQVGIEGIPADIKVSVGSTPMGMGAYYDFNTNTFTMNPKIAAELASGDPVAMAALFHEVAHANQELAGQENFGVGIEEFPEPAAANGDNYRALIEGQNDLVAHMALSNQYGQAMSNETAVDQHQQAQEIQATLTALETGVAIIGGGGLEVNKYGYQEHAEVYAALATEAAAKSGQTPQQYLISNHNEGFNLQRQHQSLVDMFPDEMSSNGYYTQREETEGGLFGIGGTTRNVVERRFPSTSEVRQWMSQHGYVDPKKAYQQMLEQAANG